MFPNYRQWNIIALLIGYNDKIILACCILHNFLRGMDNDQTILDEVDRELMEQDVELFVSHSREDDYRLGSQIRDRISNEMWMDYQNN